MHEKLLSILSGSTVGFIGGITTGKIIETVILSVIGGFLGAAGGCGWRICRRLYLTRKEKNEKSKKEQNESRN